MSPGPFSKPTTESVEDTVRRVWVLLGRQIRDGRLAKRWTVQDLAGRAGVSRGVVYLVERGESASIEAAARLTAALGLRLEIDLVDPRKRAGPAMRAADPVHSLMGEFEAAHLRPLGYGVGIDEPYQHYQFAGRADVIAWDLDARALLHLENRTRFPDFQDMAGSFNSKRAYLGATLAQRLGIQRWASETHVIAALWSSEVLHSIRLRPDSFRSLCPDPPDAFEAWWAGSPPIAGTRSAFVVLDPLAGPRQRQFIGLEEAIASARPRFRGYADVVSKLGAP